MKTYQRLLIFALAALTLTALLSPWAALFWHWFSTAYLAPADEPYPFSRIFNRFFMFSAMAIFIVFRRSLRFGSLSDLGLKPRDHAGRDIMIGCLAALASMVALAVLMSWLGAYRPFLRHPWSIMLARVGNALLAAVGAGFIEEIFFRGILFKGLREDLGIVRGYLFANLFFAAIHFVQPANSLK